MVVIDLDASRECGTAQIVGCKFSSAFGPPEAVEVDMQTENVSVKFSSSDSGTRSDGLTVFWDKVCLPDGKPWEESFCDALVQSKVFVCVISRDAIGHDTNSRQSFSLVNSLLHRPVTMFCCISWP